MLNIDPIAGTYTLSLGTLSVPWEGTHDFSGFVIPQPTTVPFWNGDSSGEIKRPLPETGMALRGQDTYPLKQPPVVHTSSGATFPHLLGLGDGNVQISWNIQPAI